MFPIPHAIPSNIAAPMFCAGLTVYSPMVRHGCGPGKKVAVVGIGGLGHFALMFGKAMGAEMTAITHSPGKVSDAKKVTLSPLGLLMTFRWAQLKSLTRARKTSPSNTYWNSTSSLVLQMLVKKISPWQIISRKHTPLSRHESNKRMLNVNGTFNQCGLPYEPLPEIKGMVFASVFCSVFFAER